MGSVLKLGSTGIGRIASYAGRSNSVMSTDRTVVQNWVRNPLWLPMPTLADTDQKFVGLVAVTNDDSQYIALMCSGNYTVDWGDGNIENISSGVKAQHKYTFSSISASTEFELTTGVVARQVLVIVTPQSGQNLTSINLQQLYTGLNNNYTTNYLDISLNSPNLTSLSIGGGTSYLSFCERVNIGVTGTITDYSYKFQAFRSLQDISIRSTSAATNMQYMFDNCHSLQTVPLFNTAAVTTMQQMFYNCCSLQTVPLFNTSAVTNMSSMFQFCYSLQTVPLFNTGAVTNMQSMFQNCFSLQTVPALNTSAVTTGNFGSIFSGCPSLHSAPLSGTKFSISYRGCALSRLQIIDIFNNLGTATSQTIDVGLNIGTSSLSAADLLIATNKGWTVVTA